jgi:hypothetical protein
MENSHRAEEKLKFALDLNFWYIGRQVSIGKVNLEKIKELEK